MAKASVPAAPRGAATHGRKLWSAVVAEWELEEHELVLLTEAVRLVDRLDRLAAAITRDGELIDGLHGVKVHPALSEARQQQIALARIMAALRLPDGEAGAESQGRRQRRAGARGVYKLRGVG